MPGRVIFVPAPAGGPPAPVPVSPGPGPVGVSCILLDAPVLGPDGQDIPMGDIRVGDLVQGGFGHINPVHAIQETTLGDRDLFIFNSDLGNTDEHPMAIKGAFGVLSIAEYLARDYGHKARVVVDNSGRTEEWDYVGLDLKSLAEIAVGTMMATWNGAGHDYVELTHLERRRLPSWTRLRSLVLGGDRTFVAGRSRFILSGWARSDKFDYETWQVRP